MQMPNATAIQGRFKSIWPIFSYRALRLLTNANLHFLSKVLVYSAGAELSVFKLLWETWKVLKIYTV